MRFGVESLLFSIFLTASKCTYAAGSRNKCRSRLHVSGVALAETDLDTTYPPRCNLGLQLLEHHSEML